MPEKAIYFLCLNKKAILPAIFSWHVLEEALSVLVKYQERWPKRPFSVRAKSSGFWFEWTWKNRHLTRNVVVPEQLQTSRERECLHE